MDDTPLAVGQGRTEAFVRGVFAEAGEARPATEWTRHRGGLYHRQRFCLWITYQGRREKFDCAEIDLTSGAGFHLMVPRLRRWLLEEFLVAPERLANAS